MSKQKKYYWLKQKADFFQDPKIKKLRRIAGGDTYTIIYQKIMLLSIAGGGVLKMDGLEETLAGELSLILDEEEINIQVTLDFLYRFNLLEELGKNEFLLPEVPKLIGSESSSAERVRKYRERKALHCNTTVTKCNTEIEKREKRKEKRVRDIYKDLEDFKNLWNEMSEKNNLKKIRTLTSKRKEKLNIRLEDLEDFKSLFVEALLNIPKSPFLLGESKQGWCIDFDWLIANDTNILKVVEGNYLKSSTTDRLNNLSEIDYTDTEQAF